MPFYGRIKYNKYNKYALWQKEAIVATQNPKGKQAWTAKAGEKGQSVIA